MVNRFKPMAQKQCSVCRNEYPWNNKTIYMGVEVRPQKNEKRFFVYARRMAAQAGESVRNLNAKRENYLDWDDYFMATAFLAAKRSKDPCTQVGACIVNDDNIIVGVGYNGFPQGCDDNVFPWAKSSVSPLENKYFYVCHAEMNAILNRNASNTKGCRIYVALFPCNECAKFIIQSGIREVIYLSNKNFGKLETVAARRMFDAAGVSYRQLIPKDKKIVIDFNEINWNVMSQLPPSPLKPDMDKMGQSSH